MLKKTGTSPSVLIIDRSIVYIRQIERLIQSISECRIKHYKDVRSALLFISRNRPDLIITAWELEDLDAPDLLAGLHSREEWRNIPVLLYDAEITDAMMNIADKYGVQGVLEKPLNSSALRPHIIKMKAFQLDEKPNFEHDDLKDLRSKIIKINTLTPLPSLVQEVLEVTEDASATARDLGDVVKKDQSLTAKVLKIVNSAYYGFHREIGNVDHAIVVLGFEELRNIALAACFIQAFRTEENLRFDRTKFWTHSLGAAYVAKALSSYTPEVIAKDAFVIGLLHDIGKVVMHQHFSEIFYTILEYAESQKRPLHEVSSELIDINHAEIGALLADAWDLPSSLVSAIRHHHSPYAAGHMENEVHIAHLANVLCHLHELGFSGNPVPDEPFGKSMLALGFELKSMDDVWESLKIDPLAIRKILS